MVAQCCAWLCLVSFHTARTRAAQFCCTFSASFVDCAFVSMVEACTAACWCAPLLACCGLYTAWNFPQAHQLHMCHLHSPQAAGLKSTVLWNLGVLWSDFVCNSVVDKPDGLPGVFAADMRWLCCKCKHLCTLFHRFPARVHAVFNLQGCRSPVHSNLLGLCNISACQAGRLGAKKCM